MGPSTQSHFQSSYTLLSCLWTSLRPWDPGSEGPTPDWVCSGARWSSSTLSPSSSPPPSRSGGGGLAGYPRPPPCRACRTYQLQLFLQLFFCSFYHLVPHCSWIATS